MSCVDLSSLSLASEGILKMIPRVVSVFLQNALQCEDGQDLTEYALLMIFIALVVVAAVTAFGNTLPSLFNSATTALGG